MKTVKDIQKETGKSLLQISRETGIPYPRLNQWKTRGLPNKVVQYFEGGEQAVKDYKKLLTLLEN